MVNPLSIQGPSGPDPNRPPAAEGNTSSSEAGAAFRAMLDRLSEQAVQLDAESRTVDDAASLSDAVDHARESLEGALELQERLLEAFRQSRQQGPGGVA